MREMDGQRAGDRRGRIAPAALAATAVLAMGTMGLVAAFLLRSQAAPPAPPAAPPPPPAAPRAAPPAKAPRPSEGAASLPPELRRELQPARMAIVIDDFGLGGPVEERMLRSSVPFTAAVIPGRPATRRAAALARAQGREVLIHLPMEPRSPKARDADAITVGASEEEVARILDRDLAEVPGAVGVNNHTGSLATADPDVVAAVLRETAQRGLFFLDSLTTPNSAVGPVSARLGIPVLHRDVFLDNVKDERYVRGQIWKLARLASERGAAIGIGHVHPVTLRTLEETIPLLERAGITVVPLAALLPARRPPATGVRARG